MKILFVWRKIDQVAGGVERMITAMMNEMVKRGHEVSLLTWDNKNSSSYYKMDERIIWHRLDMGDPMKKAGWRLRFKRIPKIRRIVKENRPDVIMCFESGVFLSIRLFLLGFNIPIIAAERNAPSRLDFLKAHQRNKVFLTLMLANKITVQFERYRNEYPNYLYKRIIAIHNPVIPATKFAVPKGKKGKTKTLLTVSRLAYQKNIAVLIEAFTKLAAEFPNWQLVIAGNGEDEQKLKTIIAGCNLENRIKLLGAVRDVTPLYKEAHLFCLPSRWEGFPNALAEAMAHGLPAVGFTECAGVSDLMKHKTTGLLAEGNGNIASLTKALKTLMQDEAQRVNMGANAAQIIEQYKPELIFNQWEALFKKTAAQPHRFSSF